MEKLDRLRIRTNTELPISNNGEEKTMEDLKNEKNQESINLKEEKHIQIAELWESIRFGQLVRGSLLITQAFLRKYIILPSVIIAANLTRILLLSPPHFFEDFKNWKKEIYVKCTYNAIPLAENEFPQNWLTDGIQIKILFPFRLQSWHRSKKIEKKDFCFLTVFGTETEQPFGSAENPFLFFKSDLIELREFIKKKKQQLKKWRTKYFRIFLRLRKKVFRKINIAKEKWVIKPILFIKKRIREFWQRNPILLLQLKEIYKLTEAKKENNSIISNGMIQSSSGSIDSIILSLRERKMKELTDRINTMLKIIEKMKKDRQKELLNTKINISPNKMSYYDKIFESHKNILKILKKRNVRFIRKSYKFLKFFVQNIYIDIFQGIINMSRINGQDSKITKSFFNNEANQERIDKPNQSIIISTIKKLLSNITNKNVKNQNLKMFWDVSYLSQAYLFYKLSQTKIINLSKLRPVFQYHGTSRFLKNEIQDYFVEVVGAHEILHSDLKQKKQKNLENSGMINPWKNWLRGHYNFDLYPIRWSKLLSQKWRNRVKQDRKNKDFNQCDSYEKKGLIDYKKQNPFETHYSLPTKKKKIYI